MGLWRQARSSRFLVTLGSGLGLGMARAGLPGRRRRFHEPAVAFGGEGRRFNWSGGDVADGVCGPGDGVAVGAGNAGGPSPCGHGPGRPR